MKKAWGPTGDELERFKEVQRLAYRCAEETAAGLEAGISEKEVVSRMRAWLEAEGVDDWFHLPFAWFGDRTAFRRFRQPLQFFPTNRVLEDGMPYILDCAPIRDGYTADIGYSGCLGDNPALDRLRGDLREHRELIVEQVRERRTLREVYEAVGEPHLGLRGVGAKFEELLVVTDDDAYWLDDDLPHARRWAATPEAASAGTADAEAGATA